MSCSPYLPASSVWLAGFLDDHSFSPTGFCTDTEKSQGERALFVFRTPPRLYGSHHSELMSPFALPSLVPHIPPYVLQRKEHIQLHVSVTKFCLQYEVSQLRCQSAHQKHSSEQLTVQVTQGSLPLSSSLSFPSPTSNAHYSLSDFHTDIFPNHLAFQGEPDTKSDNSIGGQSLCFS